MIIVMEIVRVRWATHTAEIRDEKCTQKFNLNTLNDGPKITLKCNQKVSNEFVSLRTGMWQALINIVINL